MLQHRGSKDVSGVSPGPLRTEVKANMLVHKLRHFAALPMADKEEKLVHVISEMPDLVSRQTLDLAVYHSDHTSAQKLTFTALFDNAVEKALRTPVVARPGIIPTRGWMDDRFVVVALSSDGEVLGFEGVQEGEKTFSYAVSKALCTMVLNEPKHKSPGDMLDYSNMSYLEGLGLKLGENLFAGGIKPATIRFEDESCFLHDIEVYIAAGGIHPNKTYVTNLIRGEPTSDDTLAGAVETMFGNIVLGYLADPKKEIQQYSEPDYLSQLRVLH
jgi:hypothetical protein